VRWLQLHLHLHLRLLLMMAVPELPLPTLLSQEMGSTIVLVVPMTARAMTRL